MKQIDNKTLCYYCTGCNLQENIDYKPVMRCRNFAPGIEDWQKRLREALKKNEEIQK